MVAVLSAFAEALCIAGLAQQAIGSLLVRPQRRAPAPGTSLPPVSILKPLHGAEPLLETALESFFLLDHTKFQLIFGTDDPADPALGIVEKLRRRYPRTDIAVVAGPTPPGRNRKVANLINMLPSARHELLVISDADMHVPPDFLASVLSALTQQGAGLATSFYTGLPASADLPARLGAMQINHLFLPGAALARRFGRQDCLGATMALSRATLERVGGLEALLDHLADDNVLGRKVRDAGSAVVLAPVIPATTVTETDFRALIRHELRWARTIRALVPGAYWGLVIQFPLFWAAMALLLTGFAPWAWIALGFAAMIRYAIARRLERRLGINSAGPAAPGLAKTAAPWLFLLRDGLSAAIFLASFWSDTVEWRGHVLRADGGSATTKRLTKRTS
ncbi:bacteriohopanetetrol glucosamine biosynthesis glycosyltransferase HpnI [Acidiphilium sp. AL]|uniref:Bacteriohopanetetrol glucosamine biosynthesis glycosyltransferase HpnI n=1 Tax=Acidiphilium iwatense TaxID=768198 RepID=A0ABS9E2Q6_9PROT|nr:MULTISPECIES: bacteriohopanetetrol glucosamine biosynthesis glycosyltransferase HpnI [Acidiphilium]MCF3947937.1 bacteriohopanetetrol glucosamine biosynthesis glycosyltransferase HpnI [Acidiphilium iwatense]MCU4160942.1 bacteriohopanetetrol glucosamine biosynthesis glycosyltransferase HpnI [Acidiphilium sp. AL]